MTRREWTRAMHLALTATLAVPFVTACGNQTALPDVPPCSAPTPVPTARPNLSAAAAQEFRYRRAIGDGTDRLARLLADFRAAWPGNKFSSKPEFRADFATYAGLAGCLAGDMRKLAAPPRLTEFQQKLAPVLDDYLATLERGREAVRQRNVTNYRDWNKAIDETAVRLRDLTNSLAN
ncbi:MAG: hypothetical protein IT304_06345 [Dehalococcoidia bacterium]|nr:hypothetical protein [Dehalococcoidia bacterium]